MIKGVCVKTNYLPTGPFSPPVPKDGLLLLLQVIERMGGKETSAKITTDQNDVSNSESSQTFLGSKKKEKLSVKMREDCVGIIGFQTWMLALVLVSARPWSITDRQLEFPAWGLYCGNSSPLLDVFEG